MRDGDRQRKPAALRNLEHVGGQESLLDLQQRHHQQRRLPDRPAPASPDDEESHQAVDDHRRGDRQAVGRGQLAGAAERQGHDQHADEQQLIDARQVDLAGNALRRVANGETRQKPELDGLPREGEGAGDHGLAGDDGGNRRQHHHRDQRPARIEPVEGVVDGVRVREQQGALPEIVEDQRRLHEDEPGELDRLAPEMAEIGVEGLGAGDGQEHEAHDDEADHAVRQDELDAEHRVQGEKDARIVDDVDEAAGGERGEPNEHDRPEILRDLRRPMRLHGEQQHEDRDA